ncbi:MAG: alpha/beta fold hydrolase, partial [Pseudomonadota bacterium]
MTAVIALSPIVSGRRYLRELTAMAAASPMAKAADAAERDGLFESAGFAMTDATRADISALGLTSLSKTSIRQALLIDRSDLPPDDTLAIHLAARGAGVTRLPFSGYSDMMLDAHETVVPRDMLRAVVSWLRGGASPASVGARQLTLEPTLASSITVVHEGVQVRETAVFLDVDHRLFGIVSEPVLGATRALTTTHMLLLANAGAVVHTGPNRLYVKIARTLAAITGITVIRFDLTGLGDSAPRPDEPENIVYGTYALADIAAALDFAVRLKPEAELHLAGICSGAYHSFKSALAGPKLASIVVINPLTFFWKEGMSLA